MSVITYFLEIELLAIQANIVFLTSKFIYKLMQAYAINYLLHNSQFTQNNSF